MLILPTNLFYVLCVVFGSALLSAAACAVVRLLAPTFGLVDQPNLERKVHANPTPLGGGIGIWFGIVAPLVAVMLTAVLLEQLPNQLPEAIRALWTQHREGVLFQIGPLSRLLFCGTILTAIGLTDDRFHLNWKFRLSAEFIVAAWCVWFEGWKFTLFSDFALLTDVGSMFWIVAMINAFNMLDNMDALSGGVAAIVSGLLGATLLLIPNPESADPQFFVAGLLFLVCGSSVGFLVHNRPKAKLFMGDAGSYLIGFLIAVATMMATYTSYDKNAPPLAVLTPLCVLAVPLYDMLSVIWIRLREGRSPFSADRRHFSHRLVALGLTNSQAVLVIHLLTTTCALAAMLLYQLSLLGSVLVLLMVTCVLLLVALLERAAPVEPTNSSHREGKGGGDVS
jgi:UDP-GlcNAc:undecaprenyl-phosphate GlcNAc-1-phosphate transferase